MSDETTEPEAKPEPETEAKTEAAAEAEAKADAPAPKNETGPSGTPVGKKKRKKKDADAGAEITDPRAKQIALAFDAGNFARVRDLAAELQKSDDAALAAIGRDFAARIAVDPIQIAFLGLCAIALLTIAWTYIPH